MADGATRILLIEDDEDDYLLTRDLLGEIKTKRIELEWVNTYEAGLEAIGRNRHEVYFVDYRLGQGNGLDLLREAIANGCRAPIILLTGQGDREIDVEAMKIGAADYLVKTQISAPLLERSIRYALERKVIMDQLARQALYDPLTQLPNRACFADQLRKTIARGSRRPDHLFAVLFLDLDRFKSINDSLGHMAGDQLLIASATRLRESIRPSDTVARLGGDEFTILLDGIKDTSDAARVAERVQKALSAPFHLGDQEILTSASIGIALSNVGYDRPEDILRDADAAMYRAKVLGKARYAMFDEEMQRRAVSLLQLEAGLRQAVERKEFVIHYMPVFSLQSGEMTGCEALVRWQHPQKGLLPPSEFLPLAEENGLITKIGEWLLEEAARQMAVWRGEGADLRLVVNISTREFQQLQFVKRIADTLGQVGLPPQMLELEISEETAIKNLELTAIVLKELGALGIALSIGRFGTCASPLSNLKKLPVQALKIDPTLMKNIPDDSANTAIVTAIITLAHGLGIRVVAQGIETEQQVHLLRLKQCDEIQGYLVGPPLPSDAFTRLLKKPNPAENPKVV